MGGYGCQRCSHYIGQHRSYTSNAEGIIEDNHVQCNFIENSSIKEKRYILRPCYICKGVGCPICEHTGTYEIVVMDINNELIT